MLGVQGKDIKPTQSVMVAHAFKRSTQEADTDLSSKPAALHKTEITCEPSFWFLLFRKLDLLAQHSENISRF